MYTRRLLGSSQILSVHPCSCHNPKAYDDDDDRDDDKMLIRRTCIGKALNKMYEWSPVIIFRPASHIKVQLLIKASLNNTSMHTLRYCVINLCFDNNGIT